MKKRNMKYKEFGVDFTSYGGALTLPTSSVLWNDYNKDVKDIHDRYTKTHQDGWTITAKVHEDYYAWVNAFKATHPKYGKVVGNFESKVYYTDEEGFDNFYKNHTPQAWDYMDI